MPQRVAAEFRRVALEISRTTAPSARRDEIAAGCIRIAVENMANAIKKISVQRGHDVTEYALCCFGGAAGQHACLVADALGMSTVLIHPFAGVLSAYGIGLADVIVMKQRAIEAPLTAAVLARARCVVRGLDAQARGELLAQGVRNGAFAWESALSLKYEGTDTTLDDRGGFGRRGRCSRAASSNVCIARAMAFSCAVGRS